MVVTCRINFPNISTTMHGTFTCQHHCNTVELLTHFTAYRLVGGYQWPLLLTWFNFNPRMDKQSHAQWSVRRNNLSIPKLQRCKRWSLGMDNEFHPTLFNACNYLFMLRLKLNHVSKRRHRCFMSNTRSDIRASTSVTSRLKKVVIWHSYSKFYQSFYCIAPDISLKTKIIRNVTNRPTYKLKPHKQ